MTSVAPALSFSAGESPGNQPLEPHWIAAASPDQSPSCWTDPAERQSVAIVATSVSSRNFRRGGEVHTKVGIA